MIKFAGFGRTLAVTLIVSAGLAGAAKAQDVTDEQIKAARAAIDATEFVRARAALAPFIAAPTQRVAMLMAELERAEHDDDARAREWTLRAVRAAHDLDHER